MITKKQAKKAMDISRGTVAPKLELNITQKQKLQIEETVKESVDEILCMDGAYALFKEDENINYATKIFKNQLKLRST